MASDSDLAHVADIASDISSGFKIQADEMGKVADVLTLTFTTSNTSLETLYETIKEGAPIATASGQSFKSTAALVELLWNIGIKCSQASSPLKNMFVRLAAPPKEAKAANAIIPPEHAAQIGKTANMAAQSGASGGYTGHSGKYDAAGVICSIPLVIGLVKQHHPELRTSKAGLEIIGNAEGCRRDPYICPADVLTVGVGSTEYSGLKIEPKRRYTDREIAARWASDLRTAENCVNRYGNGKAMPQGAFDAMVSLTFNMGCGAMRKSTLFRLAQQGYTPAICDQFPRWNKAGGNVLKGLVIRREKERQLCLTH